MPLHPDLAAFLDLAAAGAAANRVPLHERPVAEVRAAYDEASRAFDEGRPAGVVVEDLIIDPAAGPWGRLYRPTSSDGRPAPVLLFFHGGGYVLGGLESHDGLCAGLARHGSFVVLSVAYRRAPEHRFPAAFEDACTAYRRLLEWADGLDLDARRIAVGGDSVGGTLATALTIAARDAGWPRPVAQALLYPCTAAWQDSHSHRAYAEGYLLEAATLRWMFACTLRDDADRRDWRFAPLETGNLSGLPPATIALAEYDPLVDEGLAYAERLKAAGVPVDVRVYPGMVHDFARLGAIVDDADRVRRDVAGALAQAFLTAGDG